MPEPYLPPLEAEEEDEGREPYLPPLELPSTEEVAAEAASRGEAPISQPGQPTPAEMIAAGAIPGMGGMKPEAPAGGFPVAKPPAGDPELPALPGVDVPDDLVAEKRAPEAAAPLTPEPTSPAVSMITGMAPSYVRPPKGTIAKKAKKYGVSEKLARLIIWNETRVEPDPFVAESSKDAVGMMQVTPVAGEQHGYTPAQLLDPETNIEVGMRHLAWTRDYLQKALRQEIKEQNLDLDLLTTVAYFSGVGEVVGHIRKGTADPGGIPPHSGARDYARKYQRNLVRDASWHEQEARRQESFFGPQDEPFLPPMPDILEPAIRREAAEDDPEAGFLERLKKSAGEMPPVYMTRNLVAGLGDVAGGLLGAAEGAQTNIDRARQEQEELFGEEAVEKYGEREPAIPFGKLADALERGAEGILTDEEKQPLVRYMMERPEEAPRALASAIARNAPTLGAAIAAYAAGGPLGSLFFMGALEGGHHYRELQKMGVPEEKAADASLLIGTVNGALELVPVHRLLKKVGASNDIVLKSSLARIEKAMREGGVQGVTEAITEMAQELTAWTSEQINVSDEVLAQIDASLLDRLADSGLIGFFLGMIAAGPASMVKSDYDYQEYERLKEVSGMPDALVEDWGSMLSAERDVATEAYPALPEGQEAPRRESQDESQEPTQPIAPPTPRPEPPPPPPPTGAETQPIKPRPLSREEEEMEPTQPIEPAPTTREVPTETPAETPAPTSEPEAAAPEAAPVAEAPTVEPFLTAEEITNRVNEQLRAGEDPEGVVHWHRPEGEKEWRREDTLVSPREAARAIDFFHQQTGVPENPATFVDQQGMEHAYTRPGVDLSSAEQVEPLEPPTPPPAEGETAAREPRGRPVTPPEELPEPPYRPGVRVRLGEKEGTIREIITSQTDEDAEDGQVRPKTVTRARVDWDDGSEQRIDPSKLEIVEEPEVEAQPAAPPEPTAEEQRTAREAARIEEEREAAQKRYDELVSKHRRGRDDKAITPQETEFGFQWAIIDQADLEASHSEVTMQPNERYARLAPEGMQPRQRERESLNLQVKEIAQKLDPARLGESRVADTGAPVVGRDLLVESGNGRVMAIRLAYREHPESAERYRKWIRGNLRSLGLTPRALEGIEHPVLVRVRTSEVADRSAFARELNAPTTARMSATEQAEADAAQITPAMFSGFNPTTSGEITAANSSGFIEAFVDKIVPSSEQGMMIDDRGRLSQEGLNRIRNAVLAYVYRDPKTIAKIIEHVDENVRRIGNAMIAAAPRLAQARAAIEAEAMHDRDIAPIIAKAMKRLSDAKASGVKLDDRLGQVSMTDEIPDAEAAVMAIFGGAEQWLGRHGLHYNTDKPAGEFAIWRSAHRMAEVLDRYVEILKGLGSPTQVSLMGDAEVPPIHEIFIEAARTYHKAGSSLFEDNDGAMPAVAAGRFDYQSNAGGGYYYGMHHSVLYDKSPEVYRLWRKIMMKIHPDFAGPAADDAEHARRTEFAKAANVSARRDDLDALKKILEAWNEGDPLPPEIDYSSRGRGAGERQRQRPSRRRAEPAPPKKAKRSTGPPEVERWALEFPEIVELAQAMLDGKLPRVMKKLKGALGAFYPGREEIRLHKELFKDLDQAAAVIAHEAGHVADWLPDRYYQNGTFGRGNMFGHLATLKKYLKQMLDEMPSDPSKVFTQAERRQIRNRAARAARARLGENASKEEKRRLTAEIYQQMLEEEMYSRRLVDLETVLREMKDLSFSWRPVPDDLEDATPQEQAAHMKYRLQNEELYADFFSAFLLDPERVRRMAPTTLTLFENYFERKPEVLEEYTKLQDLVERGMEAVAEHRQGRLHTMWRRGRLARARWLAERKKARERETYSMFQVWAERFVDKGWELQKRVSDLQRRGVAIDPTQNPVYALDKYYMRSAMVATYLDMMDVQVKRLLEEAGISNDHFADYLFLRRALGERAALANPLGMGGRFAAEQYNRLKGELGDEKFQLLVDIANNFWNIRQETVISILEESGVLTGELMQHVKENAGYARFAVMGKEEEVEAKFGTEFVNSMSALKRQWGTLKEVGDPFLETLLSDIALIYWAQRQRSVGMMIDFMQSYQDQMPGNLKVTPSKRGRHGRFLETRKPGYTTIYLYRNGKAQAYDVPEGLALPFEHTDPPPGNVLKYINRPIKAMLVTHNPAWAMWNIARDTARFYKTTVRGNPIRAGIETFKVMSEALPEAIRFGRNREMSPDLLEAMWNGSIIHTGGRYYAAAYHEEGAAYNYLLDAYQVLGGEAHKDVGLWRRFLEGLSKIGEVSEKTTKLAAHKYLKKNQEEFGITDEEIADQVRNLAGTPSVYRRGTLHRFTNSTILFSGVAVQGLRGDWESFQRNPGRYAMKTLALSVPFYVTNIVVTKGIMVAAMMGALGDDLRDLFALVPESDKRNYLIIPLGVTPSGKAVVIRVPYDHVGQMINNLAYQTFVSGWSLSDAYQFLNDNAPVSAQMLNPAVEASWNWAMFLGGANPVDQFTKRSIVPPSIHESGRHSLESFWSMTKWTWNNVGASMIYRFRTDRPDEIRSVWEDAFEASFEVGGRRFAIPIVTEVGRRLIKVTDAGKYDAINAINDPAKELVATKRRLRQKAAEEWADQSGDLYDSRAAAMLNRHLRKYGGADFPDGLHYDRLSDTKKMVDRMRARRRGDELNYAIETAPTTEAREALEAEKERFETMKHGWSMWSAAKDFFRRDDGD